MSMLTTTIDLIRHGEPEGGQKFRGHTDDPLSTTGWAQMREAVGPDKHWDAIVSSTLTRCAAFAQELGARHQLPVTTDARFMEISFGEWEGHTATEIARRFPGQIERFWRDPTQNRPPGAEALNGFEERIHAAFSDVQKNFAGQRVLLVCHGGVIRMILREVLGHPLENLFHIEVPYACMTRLKIHHDEEYGTLARLVFHGGRPE
jgi:alpha-ribazole phosphatase